jgi:hypothetical protein
MNGNLIWFKISVTVIRSRTELTLNIPFKWEFEMIWKWCHRYLYILKFLSDLYNQYDTVNWKELYRRKLDIYSGDIFLILFQVPDENYDEFEGVVEVFIYLKISFWFIQPKANNMILSTEIRLNFFYKLQGQEHIQHCVSGNLMQFVINTRWNNWYSNVI